MSKKLVLLSFSLITMLTLNTTMAHSLENEMASPQIAKKPAVPTKAPKKTKATTTPKKTSHSKSAKLKKSKKKVKKAPAPANKIQGKVKTVKVKSIKPTAIATKNVPRKINKPTLTKAPQVKIEKYTWEKKWGFTPYMGVDVESRHFDFQKGYGDNLFRHDYPQGNIYVGARIKYIGAELGYQTTLKRNRINTLGPGDISAGLTIPNYTIQYQSTGQLKGFHANLVVFIPVAREYGIDLLGIAGMTRLKADFVRTSISLNEGPIPVGWPTNAVFSKKRNVFRLGTGLQHMFIPNWGVRAMIKWEKTNKFNTLNDVLDNDTVIVNKNNSVIYSVGTFIAF